MRVLHCRGLYCHPFNNHAAQMLATVDNGQYNKGQCAQKVRLSGILHQRLSRHPTTLKVISAPKKACTAIHTAAKQACET